MNLLEVLLYTKDEDHGWWHYMTTTYVLPEPQIEHRYMLHRKPWLDEDWEWG